MHKNSGPQAFSLLELLLVMVVVGIMLLLVVPRTQELMGKNRALAYTDKLKVALRFTRASAILLGEPVIFCGSKTYHQCDGLWHEGQIVITASGKLLRTFPKVFSGDKLRWRGNLGQNEHITFLPLGFTKGQHGSFYYCPKQSPAQALAVILLATGRARVATRDAKNHPINCDF